MIVAMFALLPVALASAITWSTIQAVPTPRDLKSQWEEAKASDREFAERQFVDHGFAPIELLDAANRNVRRLVLRDPHGMLGIPGIEFERKSNGLVTVQLHYVGYRREPVRIAADAWKKVVAGDAKMFVAAEYRPAEASKPGKEQSVCHAWMAFIQASGKRARDWWGCRDGPGPQIDYVEAMLETTLATRPGCERGKDISWAFNRCFGEKRELDDANLNLTYARLTKALEEAPGGNRMAEAQRAVGKPGLALGSPAWMNAREAVYRVLEIQSSRRALLQELVRLAFRAKGVSEADKVRMQKTIRHWSDFISAQDYYQAELLRSLAWAGEAQADRPQ